MRLILFLIPCWTLVLAIPFRPDTASGQDVATGVALDSLSRLPEGVETRWFSPENVKGEKGAGGEKNGGRKGASWLTLRAGKSKVLAEVSGQSGTLRRFWVTISERTPVMLRGLKIEMFWDGADKPAVSAPLGDFFCHGLGR